MTGFLFWLVIVVCALALVVLFFPILFKLEFDADEKGAIAKFYLYRKNLWTGEKRFKESAEPEWDVPAGDEPDEAPTYVAAPPRPAPEKLDMPEKKVEPVAEKPTADKAEEPSAKDTAPAEESPKVKPGKKPEEPAEPKAEDKPEKRSLTDTEFWNIILTPDFDERSFRYVKALSLDFVRMLNIKFEDCFVEGIRGDYKMMGYGAALNGIFKSFPYLETWDFRMDWCGDKELHAHGIIRSRTNLCSVSFFLLELGVYAGILYLIFRKRRKHVLLTGELVELGFIRKKILKFMVED